MIRANCLYAGIELQMKLINLVGTREVRRNVDTGIRIALIPN